MKIDKNDEALKAVAERVIRAHRVIDSGRIDQGKRMLEQLIRVLPQPSERNRRAG